MEGGGVERGTLEIAEALVEKGHESYVLSAGGRLVNELEKRGSIHLAWDIGKKSPITLLQVYKIRHWLESQNFNLIHLRSRMPAWVVWLAWRKMPLESRPRLVSTVHGLHSVNRYSEVMTCGERIIAVSDSVKNYIVENYPRTDPSKISIIYRGIDPQAFPRGFQSGAEWTKQWYGEFPQLRSRSVITLPGRITRLKGHMAFVDILAETRQQGLDVYGLIVGGIDPKRKAYAEEVKQYVAKKGLEPYIIFTGQRKDMREIYAVSNIVLSLSSKPESFGRTVLEALSMGVPVVAWDHGGVHEILSYLFPDGLCPLNDTERLSNKVVDILKKPSCHVRENDRFLLGNMQNDTISLYEDLVDK